jgi:chemotaxis protein MotB
MGKPKEDSGTWLMTYGDLMTLLLVFFVLLYTMTPGVEEQVFNSFISYFQQHSGFLPENSSITTDLQNNPNPEQVDEFLIENMERWQAMAEFIENTKETDGVGVEATKEGFLIILADSVAFLSGSSDLLPEAKKILNNVASSIGNDHWEIEVQGHTDNVPIAKGGFYQTNWHLGAARSVSVLQYIQEKANLKPELFQATSFGEHRPISTNETPEGRRANRRVEIYLKDKTIEISKDEDSEAVTFETSFNKID